MKCFKSIYDSKWKWYGFQQSCLRKKCLLSTPRWADIYFHQLRMVTQLIFLRISSGPWFFFTVLSCHNPWIDEHSSWDSGIYVCIYILTGNKAVNWHPSSRWSRKTYIVSIFSATGLFLAFNRHMRNINGHFQL